MAYVSRNRTIENIHRICNFESIIFTVIMTKSKEEMVLVFTCSTLSGKEGSGKSASFGPK